MPQPFKEGKFGIRRQQFQSSREQSQSLDRSLTAYKYRNSLRPRIRIGPGDRITNGATATAHANLEAMSNTDVKSA